MERIILGRSATLTHTFSATVTGTPTVALTRRSDGTVVTTGAVTGSSPTFGYTIPASSNIQLDTYDEVWTATQGGAPQSYADTVEVTGGALFTIADMRVLLPNATTFPDAMIADMRTLVEQAMEQVAEVAFVPRWERETINGDGSHHLVLRWSRVREIKAVTINGVAVTPVSDVVALREGVAYYQYGWTFGFGNVRVTYEHGYDNPPWRIAQAALQEAKYRLTAANSPTDARTITATYEGGTTILQQPGRGGMHFFLPETDEAVNQYSEQLKVGVA